MVTDVSSIANEAAMGGGGMGQKSAREVEVMLSANTGQFQDEMKKAGSAAGGVADALHKVEMAYVGALKVMGGSMMAMGGLMQAQATAATWSAVQFEESFARVAKTTGLENSMGKMAAAFGIGNNALQTFENDIRSLSTEIPVAVEELSGLADIAGTLGVSSENLVLFADTAAKLGAGINELGSGQAIAGLANLIGAFGESEEYVVNLGSSLAALSNNTRGSADQMLYFADRMAGTAVQVGITSDEVLGLGAAVSAIGMNPQLGASALNDFFVRVSRAVQSGSTELDKFATVMGITREEMQQLFSESPTQFFLQFIQQLGAQGDEAIVTLERLGMSGQGLTQVLGGLAAQSHVLGESLGMSAEAARDGSKELDSLAQIRWDTVVSALRRFRQSMAEVGRAMGQPFLRPLKMIIDGVTNLVNIFNKLPQPVKSAIGAFLGIGGAALVAVGAFTMFFATFHAFFALLHFAPILIGKVSAALALMGGTHAVAASTHFAQLAAMISRLALTLKSLSFATLSQGLIQALTQARAALTSFVLMARAGLAEAMAAIAASTKAMVMSLGRQLPRALAAAKAGLVPFLAMLTNIRRWAVAETLATMATALRSIGTAGLFAAKGLAPLMLMLGKFALIAAAIGAAVMAFQAWRRRNDEATGAMQSLANATGMAYEEVASLNSALDDVAGRKVDVDIAIEARDEIEMLKEMDAASAEDFLFRYAMQQVLGGAAPSEVMSQIEELARLSDTPIEFDVLMNIIADLSGEGFRELVERGAGAVGSAIDDAGGGRTTPWSAGIDNWFRGAPGAEMQENFANELNLAKAAGSNNQAARLAIFGTAQTDLRDRASSGEIDLGFYKWSQQQLREAGINQELVDEPSGWRDPRYLGSQLLSGIGFTGQERNQEGRRGVEAFQREVSAFLDTDDPLSLHDEASGIRSLVQEITGEFQNLDQAVMDLDDEGIQRLIAGLTDLSVETQEAAMNAGRLGEDYDTNLEAVLASRSHGPDALNEDDQKRFKQHVWDTYAAQVGHNQALQEAEQYLARLTKEGREFSEEGDEVRRAIESWGQELAQITIKDLQQELNAMGAAEQVRHLNRELQNLDTSRASNQPVLEQMMEMRQQAMDRAISDFRSVMSQYDSLREQEANAIENHQRRLADMEEEHNRRTERREEDHQRRMKRMREDRNKRLAEAEESYQDRLEDIAKREEELHEQRVETVQNAFGIMERIQSAPSASGSAVTHNMEMQARVMSEMQQGIQRLRQMGLNEEIMEAMGFDDPRNYAQVQRMLEEATSDPAMIDKINRAWKRHAKISEAFTQEIETSDIGDTIAKQMEEMRADAEEAYNKQIEDIKKRHREQVKDTLENYQRQVDDANDAYQRQVDNAEEAHTRQMKSIADNIAKLGEQNLESIEDLIQRGVDTGIEGIKEMATGLEDLMAEMDDIIVGSTADTLSDMKDTVEEGLKEVGDVFLSFRDTLADYNLLEPLGQFFLPGNNRQRKSTGASISILLGGDHLSGGSGRSNPSGQASYGMAGGGPIVGPGGPRADLIPIWGSNGEYVIQADAVNHYGMDFFDDVNAKRYSQGGMVGMPTSRGREPASGGGQDLVKAFATALQRANIGAQENNFGPITVEARDVNDMLRQLDHKRRVSRLTKSGGRDE